MRFAGIIRTPFQDALTPAQVENNITNRIPLHREGKPEDVARCILELVENDFITGQDLAIDGGMTMRSSECALKPWLLHRLGQKRIALARQRPHQPRREDGDDSEEDEDRVERVSGRPTTRSPVRRSFPESGTHACKAPDRGYLSTGKDIARNGQQVRERARVAKVAVEISAMHTAALLRLPTNTAETIITEKKRIAIRRRVAGPAPMRARKLNTAPPARFPNVAVKKGIRRSWPIPVVKMREPP